MASLKGSPDEKLFSAALKRMRIMHSCDVKSCWRCGIITMLHCITFRKPACPECLGRGGVYVTAYQIRMDCDGDIRYLNKIVLPLKPLSRHIRGLMPIAQHPFRSAKHGLAKPFPVSPPGPAHWLSPGRMPRCAVPQARQADTGHGEGEGGSRKRG